jgi:tetratricopeptide (TPR) repeat protein
MVLGSAAASRSDVVRVRPGDPPAGAACIVAQDSSLSVDLAKVTVVTINHEKYAAGQVGERFAADALVIAALAFESVGRTDIATRLTTGFLLDSSLATMPEIAWELSLALRRSRRLHEALDLARSLHEADDPARREASLPFLLAAMWHRQSVNPAELAAIEAVIESRIARYLDLDDEVEAGRSSYTLGNLLRSCGEATKALAAYDRAIVHDPAYAHRAYFHGERAGALFPSSTVPGVFRRVERLILACLLGLSARTGWVS